MILYRPVGVAELRLIARSGFREFPPRLPEQPIFYPVLTRLPSSTVVARFGILKLDSTGLCSECAIAMVAIFGGSELCLMLAEPRSMAVVPR